MKKSISIPEIRTDAYGKLMALLIGSYILDCHISLDPFVNLKIGLRNEFSLQKDKAYLTTKINFFLKIYYRKKFLIII